MSEIIAKINLCNEIIEEITDFLKEKYIPVMAKCQTVKELRKAWGDILTEIGVESSDEIPGIFKIEIFYHLDRVRELEEKNAKA